MKKLLLPESLSGDDLETWRRHPVTAWLKDQITEELSDRLPWRSLTPEMNHKLYDYQGRAAVLSELLRFARGDRS